MAMRKRSKRSRKNGAMKKARRILRRRPKKQAVKKRPGAKKSAKKRTAKKVVKKIQKVKKTARKRPARKATSRRGGAARAGRGGSMAVTRPSKARTGRAAAPVVPAGEQPIGRVVHYFSHLGVAVISLDRGPIELGDEIHIKGHTTDFRQRVNSMQVEHRSITKAVPGDDFGLKVKDHAREHDIVYRVKQT